MGFDKNHENMVAKNISHDVKNICGIVHVFRT